MSLYTRSSPYSLRSSMEEEEPEEEMMMEEQPMEEEEVPRRTIKDLAHKQHEEVKKLLSENQFPMISFQAVLYGIVLILNTLSVLYAVVILSEGSTASNNFNKSQSYQYTWISLILNFLAWILLMSMMIRFAYRSNHFMYPVETGASVAILWIAFALAASGSSLLVVAATQVNQTSYTDLYIYMLSGGIFGLIAVFFLLIQSIFGIAISLQ